MTVHILNIIFTINYMERVWHTRIAGAAKRSIAIDQLITDDYRADHVRIYF
jgi:hypothetical protein